MRRELVIAKIRDNAAAIQALGVASLYLYGSHARDEAQSGSDVDVFIDRDPGGSFSFIELTELEFLLQDILGVGVDLSTRTALHPALSREIEKGAVRVL
jgi:predicted nucleotidyltransferase